MSSKVYEIITEQVMDLLGQGTVPWHKPWIGGYPKNLISKKEYRGINVFLLSVKGYASPYWVSYKQAQELGGNVKKGEKSTMVVFWKQIKVQDEGSPDSSGEITEKTIPLLRYYRIFNLEQCENIDMGKVPQTDINLNFQPITACEETVMSMQNKPDICHEEPRAYYNPSQDYVNMPRKENFTKEEFYYSVIFHELGHSTGHEKRLARKQLSEWATFGSEKYSKEELVAEMTAAFLCGHHGIEQETLENSAAYIKSWLKKLQDDPKMVVLAAAQGQKAADYILGAD
jgi:antirestriction protein ArdC|tara:strand:- start:13702 stop:14559 length:858 start_codon:yes stop_codon:yes gene_type:complete